MRTAAVLAIALLVTLTAVAGAQSNYLALSYYTAASGLARIAGPALLRITE